MAPIATSINSASTTGRSVFDLLKTTKCLCNGYMGIVVPEPVLAINGRCLKWVIRSRGGGKRLNPRRFAEASFNARTKSRATLMR